MNEGKLHSDDYQFLSPREQFGQDMAVLTYQIYAKTNINNIQYNTVEIFQKRRKRVARYSQHMVDYTPDGINSA